MKNTSKKRSYLMLIAIFTMMICLTMAFGISASAEHDGAPAPEAPVEGMVQTYSVAFGGDSDRSTGSLESRTPPVAPADSVSGDNPEANLQSVDQDQDQGHGSPDAHEHHELPPEGEGTGLKDEYTSEETEEAKETAEAEETAKTEETAETVESEEIEGDELENKGTAVEESAEEEMVTVLENAFGEAGDQSTMTVTEFGTLFSGTDIVLTKNITVTDDGTVSTTINLSGTHNIYLNGFTITGTTTSALFTLSEGAVVNVYGGKTADDTSKEGTITSSIASVFQVTGGTLNVHSGNIEYTGTKAKGYTGVGINVTASSDGTKGRVIISGGTVSGVYDNAIEADSSEVTVLGGVIKSPSYARGIVATSSKIIVSGGTVNGYIAGIVASSSEVIVSGGSVSSTSPDNGAIEATNSSTVTVSGGEVSGKSNGIYAQNSSTVTVSGGEVSGKSNGIYAQNSSTVTVSGGTVSGKECSISVTSSKVTVSGGSVSGTSYGIIASSSTVIVSGGTVSSSSVSGTSYGIDASSSKIIVSGGTVSSSSVSGTSYGIHVNFSNVIVSGGTVSSGSVSGSTIIFSSDDTAQSQFIVSGGTITGDPETQTSCNLMVYGGTFSFDPSNYLYYVFDHETFERNYEFKAEQNSETKLWEVTQLEACSNKKVIGIGTGSGATFETISAALTDIGTSGTIILINDVTESVCLSKDQDIVLNLNGHVLTGNGSQAIHAGAAANLTVLDSNPTAKNTVDGTEYSGGVIFNKGTEGDVYGIVAARQVSILGGTVLVTGSGTGVYGIYAWYDKITVTGDAEIRSKSTKSGTNNYSIYFERIGTLNILNGKFDGAIGKAAEGTVTASIFGGYFTNDPYANVTKGEGMPEVYSYEDGSGHPEILATINGTDYYYKVGAVAERTDASGKVTKYGSLAKAIEDAAADNTATTIKLLDDAFTGITVAAGQNIILDLNGRILTGKDSGNVITVNGALTLKDSSTTNSGKITGTVVVSGTQTAAAVLDCSGHTGSFGESSTLTVNSAYAKVNGTLSQFGTCSITAGQFNEDPTAYLDKATYVAAYEWDAETYKYVVVTKDQVIATDSNGHSFTAVQKAIDAAGGSAGSPAAATTVTLAQNTTENITIAAGQNITLDLNGKTLTAKDTGNVITVNGTFTLKDSSTTNSGKITGTVVVNGTGTAAAVLDCSGHTGSFGESSTLSVDSAYAKVNGALSQFGTCSITAGQFSSDPTAYLDTTHAAAELADTADPYKYEVVTGDAVICNDENHGYTSVQKAITAAGTAATTITLAKSTTENIKIAAGQNITLDLYGKTLTGNVGDTIYVMGVFTLTDSSDAKTGTVTLASGKFGRGVNVESGASFTMTGGTITGYTTTAYGGGVYVKGTFTMTGGEISGNKASQGGGVYNYNGTVTVGGTAKITGNTLSDGKTASNLDLNGKTLSSITSLAEGAEIGITAGKELTAGDPFAFSGVNTADCSAYFTSDSEDCVINNISNTLYIGVPVAQISDSKYVTVQAAVDAAGGSADSPASATTTITLLQSTTENIKIAAGQNITLDLNGKTLTGTGTGRVITVKGNSEKLATFTLDDTSTAKTGTVTGGNSDTYGGGVSVVCGKFTMNGGTITGNNADAYGGGVSVNSGSEFTMNGGTITGNTATTAGTDAISSSGNTKIVNGYVDGTYSGTFTITGGKFSEDPTAYLDTNHAAADLAETAAPYKYEVVTGDAVICNDKNHGYTTVQKAITAAGNEAKTIILAKNTTENITIAAGQDITLDLNGKTLTAKDTGNVITVNGTFTLKDSNTTNPGKVTGSVTVSGTETAAAVLDCSGHTGSFGESSTLTVKSAYAKVNGALSQFSTCSITAGKFSADPTAYLDTTHAAADLTDSDPYKYEVVTGDAVICNDENHGYTSVQKAITTAGTTATEITLAQSTTENIAIMADQNITLDLNGKTLTAKDTGNVITVNGTFTLKDSNTTNPGKITGTVAVSGTETAAAVLDCSGHTGSFGESSTLTVNSAYAKVNGALSQFGTCRITAGKFSADPTAYLDTTHAAADLTDSDPYKYEVVTGDAVICNDENHGYTSVQKAIDAAGTTATEITLAQNTTENITIKADQNITLNLYGKTLTGNGGDTIQVMGVFTLTDSSDAKTGTVTLASGKSGRGVNVESDASFTMTGGTITGYTTTANGGGVCVNGTFTMTGGKISGNTANNGGGVYVNGTFTMTGGEISGNTATTQGGGVYNYNGTVTVGGTAKITGSTLSNSTTASNLDLNGKTLSIITSLAEGAEIGITAGKELTAGDPFAFAGENNAAYSAYFTSDSEDYVINSISNTLYIGVPVAETTADSSKYVTVQAAVEAAATTDTVKILTDVANDVVLNAVKEITLDLNGKTLNGTVTAKAGKISLTNADGTVTGDVTADGGTIDISNGTIDGNVEAKNSGTVTVTGGRFGGTVSKDANSTFVITGGLFVTKPDGTCLDPKYVAIGNTDSETSETYKYKVIRGGYKVGDDYYATFDDAVTAAMDAGEPIVLFRDIGADELTESIKIIEGTDVTLDLAGYSLSSKGTVLEVTGGSLIVTDTSTDKTGKITSTEGTAIAVSGGELTVTGISEISTAGESSSAISVTGGRLTLKDTVVTGPTALTVSGDKAEVTVEGRGSVLTGTETGIDVTSGRVTVKDGTVTGNDAIKVEGGKVKVLNGHIIGNAHAILALGGSADVFGGFIDGGLSDHRDGKITVYDGFFTEDPSAYIVSGYHAEAVYDSQGRLLGFVIAANTDEGTSGQGAAVTPAFTVTEVDASALNEAQLKAVENLTASGKQEVVAYVLVTENDTTDSASEDASNGASDSNEIIIKAALLKGIDPSLIHVFFVAEDGSLMEVGFTVNANGDLVIANGRPGIYVITACVNGDGSV